MSAAPDPVATLVREGDFTAYAAAQFALGEARGHLLALRAFDLELARVRSLVSEPMVGEIRLQWWRDAIENPDRADVVAHPVARALEGAVAYGSLPRTALIGLVDARADDLYDDVPTTIEDLEGRLGATCAAIIRLSTLVLAKGRDPGGAEACGFAGVAQGLARLVARLGFDASAGRILIPAETLAKHGALRENILAGRTDAGLIGAAAELRALATRRLDQAREAFATVDPVAAPAFLPLASLPGELAAAARRPLLSPETPPARWRTLLRLWRASRRTPPF